jgi:hypothetical protein
MEFGYVARKLPQLNKWTKSLISNITCQTCENLSLILPCQVYFTKHGLNKSWVGSVVLSPFFLPTHFLSG